MELTNEFQCTILNGRGYSIKLDYKTKLLDQFSSGYFKLSYLP